MGERLEGVMDSECADVSVEAARQGRPSWTAFSVAVVVVVALPHPVGCEVVGEGRIGSVELRLEGARHLANVDRIYRAVDSTDAITGVDVNLLDRAHHEARGYKLRRSVVIAGARKGSRRRNTDRGRDPRSRRSRCRRIALDRG